LEERLLAEVRAVLPAGADSIFDAQVTAITRVQRLPPSWNPVSFYRMRHGKVDWSDVPQFSNTDEFRLAEISFTVDGRRFKASLICIAGHIFDLEITPSPKSIMFRDWDAPPETRLTNDPLRPPQGRKAPEGIPGHWQNILQQYGPESPAGWILHDESSARRVSLDNKEFLIVAEKEGVEFLLYCVEPATEGLFYLAHYDGTPEPFRGEIESLLDAAP